MNNIITPYKIGFVYLFECFDKFGILKWVEKIENIIPDAGIDYILDAAMDGGAQYSAWYIGLSETVYAPASGDVMATFLTSAPECTKYDEAARPTLVGSTVAGLYSNVSSPAVFTFNASATIQLGFMSTVATKSSTSG